MAKKRKTVWGVLLGLVVGVFPAWSFELHDTGIKTCYDNAGNLIECPAPGERFYGQDAHYTGAMPSYKDNKDGTVSDRNTRLMWQQKDEFRGIWQEACDYCQALTLPSGSDGYSDWRLPTLQELVSIVDFDKKSSPSINTEFFPYC